MDVTELISRVGGRQKLQAELGVARTTVVGWEKDNRIPAARVLQICQIFKLPIEDVIKLSAGPRAAEAA